MNCGNSVTYHYFGLRCLMIDSKRFRRFDTDLTRPERGLADKAVVAAAATRYLDYVHFKELKR